MSFSFFSMFHVLCFMCHILIAYLVTRGLSNKWYIFVFIMIASPSGHTADLGSFVRWVVCSVARLLADSFARFSLDYLLTCSVVCLIGFMWFAGFLPGLLVWELEVRSLEAA